MDETIRAHLADIRSGDRAKQGQAFTALRELAEAPVPWAGAAWHDLVQALGDRDNRLRPIASQVLCNFAKSDPKRRILRDFTPCSPSPATSGPSPPATGGTGARRDRHPAGHSAWTGVPPVPPDRTTPPRSCMRPLDEPASYFGEREA